MKLSIFTIVLTLVSGTFSASIPSRFRLRTILSDAKLVGSVLDYQMCLMTSGLFLAHILLGGNVNLPTCDSPIPDSGINISYSKTAAPTPTPTDLILTATTDSLMIPTFTGSAITITPSATEAPPSYSATPTASGVATTDDLMIPTYTTDPNPMTITLADSPPTHTVTASA